MAFKNTRERIRNAEQTYEEQQAEAIKALHHWINSQDEETRQAFWRCVFYSPDSVKSQYPELMEAVTGGIDHVQKGDWELVRKMYRAAPDEIIHNILKFSMPHPKDPKGIYSDIQISENSDNRS